MEQPGHRVAPKLIEGLSAFAGRPELAQPTAVLR
jgi:hypothetical protein